MSDKVEIMAKSVLKGCTLYGDSEIVPIDDTRKPMGLIKIKKEIKFRIETNDSQVEKLREQKADIEEQIKYLDEETRKLELMLQHAGEDGT